jgi:hypothetical protein
VKGLTLPVWALQSGPTLNFRISRNTDVKYLGPELESMSPQSFPTFQGPPLHILPATEALSLRDALTASQGCKTPPELPLESSGPRSQCEGCLSQGAAVVSEDLQTNWEDISYHAWMRQWTTRLWDLLVIPG